MLAEIITIGDEILIGQIVDTNAAFIGEELNKIGVSVYQITSIQDDKEHILKALEEAKSRAQIIIITGGLGPTKDDITKHTLCTYFKDVLVQNKDVLDHVEALFKKHVSSKPISEVNRKQALVLSKAEVLPNDLGTAPGMWIQDQQSVYISLPGVPFEMKHLLKEKVIPKITSTFKRPYILHKTIITYGIGESALAEKIELWENNLPSFIKLAYLPSLGSVRLRITAKGEKEEVKEAVASTLKTLDKFLEGVTYGEEDGETIQETIAKLLVHKKKTLATAESFTGGKIASLITANPGASSYFKGSIVSYATATKIELLKVPKETIADFSVVSAEVEMAMAKNVKELLKTDFAIATTGNAGPQKGDSDVDLGTVFIAIATPKDVYVEKFMMGKHRQRVVLKGVNKAFELLQKEILKF